MHVFGTRHLVRTQRRGHHLKQKPGSGVEERQDLGDRKPATGALGAGLTEGCLQLRRVGHRERRAVKQESTVPAPQMIVRVRVEGLDQVAKQCLKDRQRKPRLRLRSTPRR